nr:hypothetical protein [Tanacetum cinerariifolium]
MLRRTVKAQIKPQGWILMALSSPLIELIRLGLLPRGGPLDTLCALFTLKSGLNSILIVLLADPCEKVMDQWELRKMPAGFQALAHGVVGVRVKVLFWWVRVYRKTVWKG